MSIVSVQKCEEYDYAKIYATLKRTFENLGGISKFVSTGTKVALKPNLMMAKQPEAAATTHPVLVHALIDYIKKAGGIVSVVESPGGPYHKNSLKKIYAVCGMTKVAKDTSATLNFDTSIIQVRVPEAKILRQLPIIAPLIKADLVINIPKLKTHCQMIYTGAVKNMYGAIPGEKKAQYHFELAEYDYFADGLIDIFLAVRPGLTIMDAIVGMDGDGPSAGRPRDIGLILASENAFDLDFTALHIIQANSVTIPVMSCARKRGLCPEDIFVIPIRGESIDSVIINDFNIPSHDTLNSVSYFDNGILKFLADIIKPRLIAEKKQCNGCMVCIKNCPAKVISLKNEIATVSMDKCIRCFCCQELCPQEAMKVRRMPKSISSFLNLLLLVATSMVPLKKHSYTNVNEVSVKKNQS